MTSHSAKWELTLDTRIGLVLYAMAYIVFVRSYTVHRLDSTHIRTVSDVLNGTV